MLMSLKVHSSAVILLLFTVTSSLPTFWTSSDMNVYISVIAIIQTVLAVWAIRKANFPGFSFPVLFVVLSSIFHFGEALLLALGRNDLFGLYDNIDLAGSMKIYNLSNAFALLIQGIVAFGICCYFKKNKNIVYVETDKNKEINEEETQKLSLAFKIGVILFSIGVVPQFLYYWNQIKVILQGGIYSGVRSSGDIGFALNFATFYLPGMFLMLIGSKNKVWRARIIILLGTAFELFCMISGNRSRQLITIISYLFIYYRLISKFDRKKGIIYAILGYFMIVLLYFISAYRNFVIATDINTLIDRFLEIASGEPVLELLAQLGSNLNVVCITLRSIPSYHPFNYGFTYIVSWLSIYPNTGGLLGDIPNMYAFLNFIDTDLPLGGSYIAELYFNFGWFSLPFALFIGLFIGWIGNKIESSMTRKNWLAFAVLMVTFGWLLWWIRDYFSCWIYRTVWSWGGVYLVKSIIGNRGKGKIM